MISKFICHREVFRIGGFKSTISGEGGYQRVEIPTTEDVLFFQFSIQAIAADSVFLFIDENREIGVVMLHARHILEATDAGYTCQFLAIGVGNHLAAGNGGIHLLQVQKSVCSTDFVHFAVDAGGDHSGFPCKAEVLQVVDPFFGGFIAANQGPAFDGIVDLGRMEGERRHVTLVADSLAVHLYTERVGRIIDDLESVGVGYFLDALGIAGVPIHMHRHDRRGVGRDCRLDFFGIQIACFLVNINENGLDSVPPEGVGGGDKTIGCRDDLARDAHRLERGNQRKGSVREQAYIFDAQIFRKGGLQFLMIMTVVGEPFTVPDILEVRDKIVKGRKERRGYCYYFICHIITFLILRRSLDLSTCACRHLLHFGDVGIVHLSVIRKNP